MANEKEIETGNRKRIVEGAKEYSRLIEIVEYWQDLFFAALDAWEREPLLLQKIIDAEDMLEKAADIIETGGEYFADDEWLKKYRGEDNGE